MKNLRNHLPLLFAILFAITISVCAYVKIAALDGAIRWAAIGLLFSYVLWLGLESHVAISEPKKGATRADRGTCEAYAFGRALTVFTALALPTTFAGAGPHVPVGLAIFFSGVLFRLSAIRTLGRFYSHRVRVMGDHQVVQSGPYRWVRHPAYTGMFFAHVGVVVVFFNPVALLVLLGVLLPAMVIRIRVEERALFELDGYARYAEGRSRLIPVLW